MGYLLHPFRSGRGRGNILSKLGSPGEISYSSMGVAATTAAACLRPLSARSRIRGSHAASVTGFKLRSASDISSGRLAMPVPSLHGHQGTHHPPDSTVAECRKSSEGQRSDLQPGCNRFCNPSWVPGSKGDYDIGPRFASRRSSQDPRHSPSADGSDFPRLPIGRCPMPKAPGKTPFDASQQPLGVNSLQFSLDGGTDTPSG